MSEQQPTRNGKTKTGPVVITTDYLGVPKITPTETFKHAKDSTTKQPKNAPKG